MKKVLIVLLTTIVIASNAQKKPKLVIGIVIDQMRQDYLLRYSDKFSDEGFNRLLKDGYQFKNAHYNYVPTYTAPGHASIYTGTTPSNHGIIGNSWFSRETGLRTYCVTDASVSGVGGGDNSGKMSPKNLIVTTITDELRMSSNFSSKVVGVSIKDRGSILPAGHNPTGAYWFDSRSGNFITSTYYTNQLPAWVTAFNKKKLVSKYLEETWNTLLPIEKYTNSTEDDVPYERVMKGKQNPVFPYNLKELAKSNGLGLIRETPWGNTLVLDMAIAAIEGEDLGTDSSTDFLAVSFSSTDYVGHAYGPNSVEMEDTYIRLDLEIKRLLTALDEKFGDEYLVFLTSDHGVSNVPLYLNDMKMPGGYTDGEKATEIIKDFMTEHYGEGDWVLNVSNDQVFLNRPLIAEKQLDLIEIQEKLSMYLLSFERVVDSFTADNLAKRSSTNKTKKLIENGFNTKASGDVVVRHKSGYVDGWYGKEGTTHGSGYNYDTHIPIIFYGKNIKSGESVRPVAITDIAPTLSMLLNISLPSAATGSPLKELFE